MYYNAIPYSATGCCYGPGRVMFSISRPGGTGNPQFEIRPRFGNGWISPVDGTVAGGADGDYVVKLRDLNGTQLTPLLKLTIASGVPTLALFTPDPDSNLIVGGRLDVRELIRIVNLQSPGKGTSLVFLEIVESGTAITSISFEWEAA